LRQAEHLSDQRRHSNLIVEGYNQAAAIAMETLSERATVQLAEEEFEENLVNLARTTLASKIVKFEHEERARLATFAILLLEGSLDLDLSHIIKIPGAS